MEWNKCPVFGLYPGGHCKTILKLLQSAPVVLAQSFQERFDSKNLNIDLGR